MRLKDLKSTYFAGDKRYDFLLPIGSTEQHGPFIPFGTDTYIADSFLDDVERDFPELIMLPTLEYSCAEEHRGYYGTIWLSVDTMTRVLSDICASLESRARYIFLLNWHGGNIKCIDSFVTQAQGLFPNVRMINIPMYDDGVDDVTTKLLNGSIDEHAGNTEISLILAIRSWLAKIPDEHYPKNIIHDAWSGNDLASKSHDGIVDNHPRWVVSKELWDQLRLLHSQVIISNLRKYLSDV